MKARIINYSKTIKQKNRWNAVFGTLLTSLIIFSVLFGTPILGSFSADFLFETILRCDITSGMFDNHSANHACMLYDWDIRSKVQAYSTPGVSFFFTPISFILAFFDVLIVWGLMLLFVNYKKTHYQKQEGFVSNVLYWVLTLFPYIIVLAILFSPNRYDNYEVRQYGYKQEKSSNNNFTESIRF